MYFMSPMASLFWAYQAFPDGVLSQACACRRPWTSATWVMRGCRARLRAKIVATFVSKRKGKKAVFKVRAIGELRKLAFLSYWAIAWTVSLTCCGKDCT